MSVEERALYAEMKDLPDFLNYPLPQSWYKEFGIPQPTVCSLPDFLKSGYTTRIAFEPKNLPPLIINKPQQNGKLAVVPHFEVPEVSTTTRPFALAEGEDFPAVLPALVIEEAEETALSPCQTECLEQKESALLPSKNSS